MGKTLFTAVVIATVVVGIAPVTPALAGPTAEQAAAEWLEQSPTTTTPIAPDTNGIAAPADPMKAANGMAQRRTLSVEQQQLQQH